MPPLPHLSSKLRILSCTNMNDQALWYADCASIVATSSKFPALHQFKQEELIKISISVLGGTTKTMVDKTEGSLQFLSACVPD